MVDLKACPKCHGDVYIRSDVYGQYKGCFQCGYVLDIPHQIAEVPAVLITAALSMRRKPGKKQKVA